MAKFYFLKIQKLTFWIFETTDNFVWGQSLVAYLKNL